MADSDPVAAELAAELAAIRKWAAAMKTAAHGYTPRGEALFADGPAGEWLIANIAAAAAVPRLLKAVEAALEVHAPVPVYEIALHQHEDAAGSALHCGHPYAALEDDRHAESDEGDWICLDKLFRTACGGCWDDEGEMVDFADCRTRAAIAREMAGKDAR